MKKYIGAKITEFVREEIGQSFIVYENIGRWEAYYKWRCFLWQTMADQKQQVCAHKLIEHTHARTYPPTHKHEGKRGER